MEKHPDNFNAKLINFDFGIVCQCSPEHLDRREDLIFITLEQILKALIMIDTIM